MAWARRMLAALGAIKLAGALYGLKVMATGTVWSGAPEALRRTVAEHQVVIGLAAFVWYGGNAAAAWLIASAMKQRRPWAYPAGVLFGGLHAFGLMGLLVLDPIFVVNGALGVLIAVMTLLANARGAFRPGIPHGGTGATT